MSAHPESAQLALAPVARVHELTHAVEALLFVASQPLSLEQLAALTDAPTERVARALDALAERYCEGRSGVVLEHVAGGYGFRAARPTAAVCARLVDAPQTRPLSQASLETLAIIAYLEPVSRPEITRIRGVSAEAAVASLVERGLIVEDGRSDAPGAAILYRTTTAFRRLFGLEGPGALPPLDGFDPGGDEARALRARLHLVADQRAAQP